ncbi:tail protein [Cyanophage S-2L]|nr:tail protein [Cyanophage S-2L]
MDVTATFLPVAAQLIDRTFPTPILYRRAQTESYDPATGVLTRDVVEYPINAGVLGYRKSERSGAEEAREVRLWIHHGPGGLPDEPTTGDTVAYDGGIWRVTEADPTYTSQGLIASQLVCEYQYADV